MPAFFFTWQEQAFDSVYQQPIIARDLQAAKRRWRRYWSIRQKDCGVFETRVMSDAELAAHNAQFN